MEYKAIKNFQGVSVETCWKTGATGKTRDMAWTELKVQGQPEFVRLEIQANEKEDISSFIVFQGSPHRVGSFQLETTVGWFDGLPRTRWAGEDNLDVIFIDDNLHIKDVQVGLVTRKGRFFVTAQVVFTGWVRRSGDEMKFIPAQAKYAYPGQDYGKIWPDMGRILETIGRVATAIGEPKKRRPAKWTPVSLLEKKGWLRGTVLFFNAVTGTGEIAAQENGGRYFVHFSRVLTDHPIPLLEAGEGVYFRLKDGKIRSCLPA